MMVNVSSGVESGVGANPVDRYFNRGDYLAFGPSPYYANLRWGYSLSASSPIAVYFMDSGDFTTFKNTGGGTIIYYTAWSVPKGSNPYCPLNTGSGADYFYIVIYQQYSTGAVRVTGSVTFETFFRDNATVAAPALSSGMMGDAEVKYTRPHAAVAGPDALESGKPVAFSLMPGEMWKSVMVGKGNGLDIGFSINGTNRFNVLLLDSDNLAKFEAHQLFNYYAFYSRTDVLFAHLEIETVLNLPVDVYLVINCVDSLQRVSIVGDITFAIDDRRA
jgi:hypothetical protein